MIKGLIVLGIGILVGLLIAAYVPAVATAVAAIFNSFARRVGL